MSISILEDLTNFEKEQLKELENKKIEFHKILEKHKQELLEHNDTELYTIKLGRHDRLKEAKQKAKLDSLETIKIFEKKTKELEKSKERIEEATNLIFTEFKNV